MTFTGNTLWWDSDCDREAKCMRWAVGNPQDPRHAVSVTQLGGRCPSRWAPLALTAQEAQEPSLVSHQELCRPCHCLSSSVRSRSSTAGARQTWSSLSATPEPLSSPTHHRQGSAPTFSITYSEFPSQTTYYN